MTNGTHNAASEVILKPIAEIQQVLAEEVSQGREFVDIALRWLTENGISFVVNVLVALLLLADWHGGDPRLDAYDPKSVREIRSRGERAAPRISFAAW